MPRYLSNPSDIPDRNQTPDLPPWWKVMESEELKGTMIFSILGRLRGFQVDKMSNEELRAGMAELKTYAIVHDFATSTMNSRNQSAPQERVSLMDEYEIEESANK